MLTNLLIQVWFAFSDNDNVGVKQHHFCSSSITEVCTCVKCCWKKCLNNGNLLISTHTIKKCNKTVTNDIFYLNPNDTLDSKAYAIRKTSQYLIKLISKKILF